MIDGGMRMNPYIHDRKNGASLFRNKRTTSRFFFREKLRSYDNKSIMLGVTSQYFNLTTK